MRSDSRAAPGSASRRLAMNGKRAAHGAHFGIVATRRSFSVSPCFFCQWKANSIFIFAMSTPVGQSRLQPLQLTQSESASRTASLAKSVPSWPETASRSVLARPRVECSSSRVTRKLGHIVPASNLRQWPLLLHISTALANPRAGSPPVPGAVTCSVTGFACTFHDDQSSAVSSFSGA